MAAIVQTKASWRYKIQVTSSEHGTNRQQSYQMSLWHMGIAAPSGHRLDTVKPYHEGQQRDILARSVELDTVEVDLEDMISTLSRRNISVS